MAEETTLRITYGIMMLGLAAAGWFIWKKAQENKARMIEEAAPKVAGDDLLEGGAKDSEQFDEPDEEALDEMADLLGLDDEDED